VNRWQRIAPELRRRLGNLPRYFGADNLARMVIALVLAFALWAWVTARNDPETARTFSPIQVTPSGLDPSLVVVNQLPPVQVRVQGPRSRIETLESGSIQATVDLSEIREPGIYTRPVKVRTPRYVRVREVTPPEVTVQIDRLAVRENVPVEPAEPTNVPPNLVIRSVTVQPNTVTLTGPQEALDQVARVEAPVRVEGRAGSFQEAVAPVVLDENGAQIPGIRIEPPNVTVFVELEVRGQVRRVVPSIVGTNQLPPGYELAGPPTVIPTDEVVVEGPEEAVDQIPFISTVPIDVSGLTESRIFWDVPLDLSRLPAGVTVDRQTVHISVQIRRSTEGRTLQGVPIQTINVLPGTQVQVNPAVADVRVEGPQALVTALTAADITVYVDVGYAEAGIYQLPLRVSLPPGVQYQSVTPEVVQVTIQSASPTPTSPPSP
jgi:YbbR domain-containing protein